MEKQVKRALVVTVGIIFIILGFFGLVLPVLQGILFLAIGLILLSLCSPTLRSWVDKHAARYPKLLNVIQKFETWITKFVGEV